MGANGLISAILGTKKKGSGSQALSQPLIGLGVACPTLPRISFQHHGEDVDSAGSAQPARVADFKSQTSSYLDISTYSLVAALRKGIPARS